jgi:hypothetical protein
MICCLFRAINEWCYKAMAERKFAGLNRRNTEKIMLRCHFIKYESHKKPQD